MFLPFADVDHVSFFFLVVAICVGVTSLAGVILYRRVFVRSLHNIDDDRYNFQQAECLILQIDTLKKNSESNNKSNKMKMRQSQ